MAEDTKSRAAETQRSAVDEVLGVFRHVPPSAALNHAVRFLSTWSGTDKACNAVCALMFTQYSSKIVISVLMALHALRQRMRLVGAATPSKAAARVQSLGSVVADARVLYRIWGVLPIIQWLISLERVPPPTRLLLVLERLQGWSMVLFYPMEAVAYLAMHNVITMAPARVNRLYLWACRFWALYVGLQLMHLVEDNRLLRLRAKALERSRGHPYPAPKKDAAHSTESLTDEQQVTRRMWADLNQRKDAILTEVWVNIGYLPLTLHWSLATGLISETWVGVFGTIAAAAGIRSGWKASAAP
ncbi:hypothetical protein MSPP1_001388 [Malassezia sp. CBS 17886]|nr:hypothetical protein MSPP1_001388 [Malassezia sp. CBS 17886]